MDKYKLVYIVAAVALGCDIWRQLSADLRHASAHFAIKSLPSAKLSQLTAQRSQISEQTPQICG